jgi:hypothetical protein
MSITRYNRFEARRRLLFNANVGPYWDTHEVVDRQLLDDDDLHASAVVANCSMNRDRLGTWPSPPREMLGGGE